MVKAIRKLWRHFRPEEISNIDKFLKSAQDSGNPTIFCGFGFRIKAVTNDSGYVVYYIKTYFVDKDNIPRFFYRKNIGSEEKVDDDRYNRMLVDKTLGDFEKKYYETNIGPLNSLVEELKRNYSGKVEIKHELKNI